ncbi:hypothetical protein Q763_01480 [Flavobacterium beibuense F44-8]|uniref:Uncharacterized protein n=1 Tax=Flavobacterium beibuense F44-8 TaxID=1406840 RepID=A0A0A2LYK6_9FLAO|nr:hypothetical protein [Flavobacterium beibuense]KGO84441.1 hypothetical protein Q763_01480 [Flavobacterium beibuense F44-8]
MELKKPSGNKVKDTIVLTGGVLAGGAASRGIFGLIHENKATEDAAAAKKQENTALIKRGAMSAAAGTAAVFIDGKDLTATLVKGLCIGITVVQGLEVVKTLASRAGVTPEVSATTKSQKVVAQIAGLGCPCNETKGLMYNAPSFSPRYVKTDIALENERVDNGIGLAGGEIWNSQDIWATPASA